MFALPKLAGLAALLAAGACASPVNFIPVADDIVLWSADITNPTILTVWTVGKNVTVTWDASKVPQTSASSSGILLLGYEENQSENLDIQSPLATGFLISDEQVSFIVPNVTTRTDYIVVLLGNSGNTSPTFTIFA